jgi:hypothetical protein
LAAEAADDGEAFTVERLVGVAALHRGEVRGIAAPQG